MALFNRVSPLLLDLALPPTGRLTLTSGVPVMTADVTAATTIYYTAGICPIYNGSQWLVFPFAELSLTLDTTNCLSGKNYDVFLVWDAAAGQLRLVYGPAWTSDTARASAISRVSGIWVNTASLTGRYSSVGSLTVGAGVGTYVGTFRASANGQTQVKFGSAAAGGGEAWLGIWNAYTRVPVACSIKDTTGTHAYTTASFRAYAASNTMRASFIRGLDDDGVIAALSMRFQSTSTGYGNVGIGLDSITALATFSSSPVTGAGSANAAYPAVANYSGRPGLGFHYLQALEQSDGVNANNFGAENLFSVMLAA